MRTTAVTLLGAVLLLGCTETVPSNLLRIAVAKFSHEACTFCPGGDTEIDDWLKYSEALSGEELLSSGSYIRGFTKRARELGDVELVPLTSPIGVFGGSSRS